MESLLETLRQFDALRDQPPGQAGDKIVIRTVPCRKPAFAPKRTFASLPDFLQGPLNEAGIFQLYAHQAEAIATARRGEDMVLESPTASGKTLCFNIPLLLTLLSEPQAHALMLHPMKALSNDQRRQFEQLTSRMRDLPGRRIESWLYDGDTDPEYRRLLRRNPPAVLMTNPEMLHLSFLGWSQE